MTELNHTPLDEFQKQLEAMKAEIESLLGLTSQDARPVDLDLPIGRLSRADAMQMQEMAGTNRRQLEVRLQQVKGALKALEEGSYGSCRNCHGAINLARLEIRPESPFCIECQEMFEQER